MEFSLAMNLSHLVLTYIKSIIVGTYGDGMSFKCLIGNLKFVIFGDKTETYITVLLVTLVEC